MFPKPTKSRKKAVKTSAGKLYMVAVKGLPCVACGRDGPSEAHHTRSDSFGGRRASDFAVIPLCLECHRVGPNAFHNNKGYWEDRNGKDWSFIPDVLEILGIDTDVDPDTIATPADVCASSGFYSQQPRKLRRDTMLTKEQIQERLSDRVSTTVAKRIGVSTPTVNDLKRGKGNPSYKTLLLLSEYLEKHP